MSVSYEESDSKAGFYYDLKFVMILLYIISIVGLVTLSSWPAFADFALSVLIFISVMAYLDLQEFVEVKVSRYGWKCQKNDYKIASAFLIVSFFLIPTGKCFLESGIAESLPLFFFLSLGLLLIPTLIGISFAFSCYLDFGCPLVSLKRDEEIVKVLLKHSYFYRKIFGRKSAQKANMPS